MPILLVRSLRCIFFFSGIVHAMLYVGVGVGFVLGGEALNLYVDFDQVPNERQVFSLKQLTGHITSVQRRLYIRRCNVRRLCKHVVLCVTCGHRNYMCE